MSGMERTMRRAMVRAQYGKGALPGKKFGASLFLANGHRDHRGAGRMERLGQLIADRRKQGKAE